MVRFYCRICMFFVGIVLGILIGKSCITVKYATPIHSYDMWFKKQEFVRKSGSWDTLRYKQLAINGSVIEADFLFKKVTILCIILLKNKKYATPVKTTWAKGCNLIRFVDIQKNKSVPIKRDLKDSSWVMLCQTLQDVGDYHWLLITSDLTFVIMENLRHFLAPLHPEDQYYLGHTVEFWRTFYNSIHAGVVLSRATLNTFRTAFSKEDCLSFSYWNKEDYYLGKSLASLNITPIDTRDANGFSVFYPHNLNSLIFYEESKYKKLSVFPIRCCSKHTISFQAIDGDKMYTYYYLLYTVQLFTEGNMGNIPNSQEDDDQVWKDFLKQRNITNDKITSAEYYQVWENLIDDPTSFAAHMKRDTAEEL